MVQFLIRRGAMVAFFSALALGTAIAQVAQNDPLDSDFETRVNPQTGNVEQVFNPWRTERIEAERTERDYRLQRQMTDRDYQSRAEQRNNLRNLSNRIYQTNVNTINQRHLAGLSVIRAGRANTSFTSDPNFSISSYLVQRYPPARREIERLALPMSAEFHAALRANSLNERDLADGHALAFITAFEAYSGQKTARVHLTFAQQTLRTQMLRSSIAQGASSAERQKDFEHFGVLAFAAKQLVRQGDPMGREIAASVLAGLAKAPAYSIAMTANGFTHRGDQIIAARRATTTFNPATPSPTPGFYARRFNSEYVSRSTFENNAREAIDTFYTELARRGERRTDMAVLVAYLLATNATAISGQEPNAAQIQSAKDIARSAILRSRDIQAAPDAEKQLALELTMISSVEALRERNATTARANIRQIFQALGEDPMQYELTATGIRKVR